MQKPFIVNKLCCAKQDSVLFSDISFELDDGGVLLVEGANGSGKSSLLRLLAGLATPVSGDILWSGESISSAAEFKPQLHYLGHSNGLRLDLTVAENLNSLDITLLTALQLQKHLSITARSLSAGQKRKVALAALILARKKLWLLDEPLTALDTEAQIFFLAQLQKHLQQGGIAVISSHQPLALTNVKMQILRLS